MVAEAEQRILSPRNRRLIIVSDPDLRPSPWHAIAAATALNAPLGSLYAFSVLLTPLETLLALSRAELALVFAVASAAFGGGMNLAPTSTASRRLRLWSWPAAP